MWCQTKSPEKRSWTWSVVRLRKGFRRKRVDGKRLDRKNDVRHNDDANSAIVNKRDGEKNRSLKTTRKKNRQRFSDRFRVTVVVVAVVAVSTDRV